MSGELRILEELPIALVRVQHETISFANAAFASLVGEPLAALVGRPVQELLAPEDLELVMNTYRARQRGEPVPVAYEVSVVRRTGELIRVEIEPRVIGEGDQIVLVRSRSAGVRDRELLAALADLSARLQRTRGLDALLEATTNGLRALGTFSAVMRLDGDDVVVAHATQVGPLALAGGVPVAGQRLPLSQSPRTAEAIRSGRAVYEGDLPASFERFAGHLGIAPQITGSRLQALFAPLFQRGVPWGVLVVASPVLTPEDGPTISLFASQLSSMLEVATTVAELELLLDATQAVAGTLEMERVLSDSARIATRIVAASHTFIWLLEPATGDLLPAASSEPDFWEQLRTVRIPAQADSLAIRAVRERRPISVAQVSGSSAGYAPIMGRFGEQSLLAVPLMARDATIGALVLASRKPRVWSGPEIERVSGVATQVALAVSNARLFDDLRKSYAELARTQKELLERERLAALGELSALVAHEVRNPLGVIFNSLGSLQKILVVEGDARMLLDIVGEEAERLNRIVSDLLDFARPRDPELQAAPVPELIEQAVAAAIQAAGEMKVRIERDVPQDLPHVPVDGHMIRRALLNMVLNGMQAMPKGGTLTLRARAEEGFLRLDVIDSGPGVPPEFVERIFEPFFTTKAAGTGLGLAVVRRIVEAHHGMVEVDSVAGAGARFTLRLPLTEAGA